MTPMDTNMAAVILSNGSLVGMWRDHEPTGKSVPHLVTATNWKDAKTYVYSRDDSLFGKKKVNRWRNGGARFFATVCFCLMRSHRCCIL